MRWPAPFALILLCGLASGCESEAFHCLQDEQCGETGRCEANGSCSFDDETCDSGRRFGELAPQGIANACVPMEPLENEPLQGSAPDAGADPDPQGTGECAGTDSCDACLACASADSGPCGAALSCGADVQCHLGMTCIDVCVGTGKCGDCCEGTAPAVAERIAAASTCVVAECADLCGDGFEPTCS